MKKLERKVLKGLIECGDRCNYLTAERSVVVEKPNLHVNGNYFMRHKRSVLLLMTPGAGMNTMVSTLQRIVRKMKGEGFSGLEVKHIDDYGYRLVDRIGDEIGTNITTWTLDLRRLAFNVVERDVLHAFDRQFNAYGKAFAEPGTYLTLYVGYVPLDLLDEVLRLPWYKVFCHQLSYNMMQTRVSEYRANASLFDKSSDAFFTVNVNVLLDVLLTKGIWVDTSKPWYEQFSDSIKDELVGRTLYELHNNYVNEACLRDGVKLWIDTCSVPFNSAASFLADFADELIEPVRTK